MTIIGEAPSEATGNELRIADVTGDGLGDLVIAGQNYRATAPDRIGAGALTVVVGGAALRGVLQSGGVLDLGAPPDGIALFTLVGPSELGRLGMFVRTGDVTGDGVDDIVLGADQEGDAGEQHRGAMYVVRGGAHLAASATIDLADFGSTSAAGHIAKIEPPSGSSAEYHFGATVEVRDLDGNGRAEVLGAAALIRGGGAFLADGAPRGSAHGGGGADNGRVYIVWDENLVGDTWAAGYTIQLDDADHLITLVQGGTLETRVNSTLGEEMVAGGDYDGDGRLDLFLGDMSGSPTDERPTAGIAYVIYSTADLKQFRQVQVNEPPELLYVTVFLGPVRGVILGDTAVQADFDGDGYSELAIAAPNATPRERYQAGTVYIFWGNSQRWPALVDLLDMPDSRNIQITHLLGAAGREPRDSGDMLAYSAAVADFDRDGLSDLMINEMGGNGQAPDTIDVGNFLILSREFLRSDRPDCSGRLAGTARLDACGTCWGGATGVDEGDNCVSFSSQIEPILFSECVPCHGAAAGLSVGSYEALMAGDSYNGPAVVPGVAEESLLLQKLRGSAEHGQQMPSQNLLAPEQIELFRVWIHQGARPGDAPR